MNIWSLDPRKMTVIRVDGETVYRYTDNGHPINYAPHEILDIPWMLAADGLTHVDPIHRLRDTLGLAMALETYASRFFASGGVVPLQLVGPLQSPLAAQRASADITAALATAREQRKSILPLPTGFELKPIAFHPEQGQMIEAQRFVVEQVARIYGLPPQFLQDLSRSTFSNSEQADLNLAKHCITHWVTAWEQELTLKLFSDRNRVNYVRFNLGALLRGDHASRMAGHATAIQNAIMTPNEARALEELPTDPEGNDLMIQGATVRLKAQPEEAVVPMAPEAAPEAEEKEEPANDE
jgi:HK97 family phage portal protein